MTILHHGDGHEELLLGPSDAVFDIRTWCSDTDGKCPAAVHLIIEPVPGTRLLYRFTGPVALTRLIEGLTLHRDDVWPEPTPRPEPESDPR